MAAEDNRIVPIFKTHTMKNEAKSAQAGRPIFDELEVVEVRFAGNRFSAPVFPAHAIWSHIRTPDGTTEPQTYAQRWPDQYKRFKAKETQIQAGTPVEELPFLTAAKRSELKALSIYTAETLAALDGQELKTLGQGGRELKNQAQAYLDNASGSAVVTRLAAEVEALKQQLAEAIGVKAEQKTTKEPSAFDEMPDDELKQFIKEVTGSAPRGQPSHETLVRMAEEAENQRVAA
jgi:hypothetical protein